jgi:excisionase family DNA binding protein
MEELKQETEQPLLYSLNAAARLLCLSRRTVERMAAAGELRVVRAGMGGRAVRITRTSLEQWLADQLAEGERDGKARMRNYAA